MGINKVKWIKKYKQDGDKQYTILFIKHFFNLTREDLEEKE